MVQILKEKKKYNMSEGEMIEQLLIFHYQNWQSRPTLQILQHDQHWQKVNQWFLVHKGRHLELVHFL